MLSEICFPPGQGDVIEDPVRPAGHGGESPGDDDEDANGDGLAIEDDDEGPPLSDEDDVDEVGEADLDKMLGLDESNGGLSTVAAEDNGEGVEASAAPTEENSQAFADTQVVASQPGCDSMVEEPENLDGSVDGECSKKEHLFEISDSEASAVVASSQTVSPAESRMARLNQKLQLLKKRQKERLEMVVNKIIPILGF